MSHDFYRAFEDRYRGSRELIKKRLDIYIPFIKPLLKYYPEARAIDLGCGRGEWLELLASEGFNARGVDIDDGMLSASYKRGFNVYKQDAIEALKESEDSSVAVVSAFHLVEHIEFDCLRVLVAEAKRVLVPGGILILETPNPENIVVSGCSFYSDPTHKKPIPPSLLSFVTEYEGFLQSKVIRLQEDELFRDSSSQISLLNVLKGVSPDYAIVAQNKGNAAVIECNAEAFEKEYGVSLQTLASRYTHQLDSRIDHLLNEIDLIHSSNSWRITAPLRRFRRFVEKAYSHILTGIKSSLLSVTKIISKVPLAKSLVLKLNMKAPFIANWLLSSEARYNKLEPQGNTKDIFIDITHVYKNDLKTGIQRVVRAITSELENISSTHGYKLWPVFLTDSEDYWHFEYVTTNNLERTGVVVPKSGDIFLGLDLNSGVSGASYSGMFNDWRRRGAKIAFVVYDLLPIKHPQWWDESASEGHLKWLSTIARESNQLICISKSVMKDLELWISNKKSIKKHPQLSYFHLGSDIENSVPSKGIPNDADAVLSNIRNKTTFLMVGTLEPRKGHLQVINAFEHLWKQGCDINLMLVGKQGWMVCDLIRKIQSHKKLNDKLFWLDGISDEYLEKIYGSSDCLIAASGDEGFGLPLIEAAKHKIPIIARDIPVFREVAGTHAFYFDADEPEDLARSIENWMKLYNDSLHPSSEEMPWLTWKQSTQLLLSVLLENRVQSHELFDNKGIQT